MKFAFINPGPNTDLPVEEKGMVGAAPPLGTLYIATVLRKEGIDVSVIDEAAQGFSFRGMLSWVKKENPDVLGFSTYNISGSRAARIAKKVKEENPNVLIVFGNFYATFNAERILKKYPWVDVIIRGEGEYTSLELIKSLEKKENFKKVLGITFRVKDQILTTPDRPLIRDIDSLPFPDRELLDAEYHSTTMGINVAPKKFTTFVSSRGCAFSCRFCGCQRLARGLWRPRSVDNLIQELLYLVSEGYKQLLFVDDNFTLNPKRVIELCKRMRKEKIDAEWIADGRVSQCSRNMLREMVKANCKMLYLGIESANMNILNYYNKQTTPEQAEIAVENARSEGVDVIVGSFILGASNETKQEIQNTINFAQELKVDIPQFNILSAFPGTDIWEELRMKGVLNEEKYWETGVFVSEVSPNTVPYDEIKLMVREGYRRFLTHPRYILRELFKTFTSRYRINLLFNNLNRIDTITENVRSIT